tara:strand:+ start:3647 stop:4357 length:711 start_codon:yes stop_codon:yes gene_type:complete
MTKEKGKKIKLECSELTLWKTGTIVFGILFVFMFLKGGAEKADLAPSIPSAEPSPAAAPSAPADVEIGDAYFLGKKNAKIEIIEFSDFQCPFCKRFFDQTMGQIMDNYVDKGKVKFAYKHLPLPFHSDAQKAAEATECAGKVGGDDFFWGMHDKIFENQQAIGVSNLKSYASELGLDQGKFDSCLDDGDTAAKVKAHAAEASKLGASGTPTFFINGVKVVGAQPYAVFEQAIEAAL